MHFHIITLFPESIQSYREASVIGRAEKKGLISITVTNPRDHSHSKHNTVDDKPYGGGPGMVMMALPVLKAIEASLLSVKNPVLKVLTKLSDLFSVHRDTRTKYVVFSPKGTPFTNDIAHEWAQNYKDIVLVCGRYEGVDDRVRQIINAEEISIGEYVLTGGELPALVVIDAVARQIPGVLGNSESLEESRTASPRMYTRPESFVWKGKQYEVPHVLIEGNHAEIEKWRKENHDE